MPAAVQAGTSTVSYPVPLEDTQNRRGQRGEVGVVEILLAEVHEGAAFLDRQLPIVIDDELRPSGAAEVAGAAHLRALVDDGGG